MVTNQVDKRDSDNICIKINQGYASNQNKTEFKVCISQHLQNQLGK